MVSMKTVGSIGLGTIFTSTDNLLHSKRERRQGLVRDAVAVEIVVAGGRLRDRPADIDRWSTPGLEQAWFKAGFHFPDRRGARRGTATVWKAGSCWRYWRASHTARVRRLSHDPIPCTRARSVR